jgi:hypothetical protein
LQKRCPACTEVKSTVFLSERQRNTASHLAQAV